MTQLTAQSRGEADLMDAAILLYARPHLDAAADIMRRAATDAEAVLDNLPARSPERQAVEQFVLLARRYATQMSGEEPEVADTAPSLGLARGLAISEINAQADLRVDAIVLEWARGVDLPVMEVGRVVQAALVTAVSLTHKRAMGLAMSPEDLAAELGLQGMQARQSAIRATQRDHIRAIDGLTDIEAVRAYPQSISWPET
jgi:hypothetical protein